jgi:hypothetical protein
MHTQTLWVVVEPSEAQSPCLDVANIEKPLVFVPGDKKPFK